METKSDGYAKWKVKQLLATHAARHLEQFTARFIKCRYVSDAMFRGERILFVPPSPLIKMADDDAPPLHDFSSELAMRAMKVVFESKMSMNGQKHGSRPARGRAVASAPHQRFQSVVCEELHDTVVYTGVQ